MAERHDTMMNPAIEQLLRRTGSKFRLVTVGASRARQINAYFNQLGEGLGAMVPPQVTSLARKPLSIAFEEIDGGKIVGVDRAAIEAGLVVPVEEGQSGEAGDGEDSGDGDDTGPADLGTPEAVEAAAGGASAEAGDGEAGPAPDDAAVDEPDAD